MPGVLVSLMWAQEEAFTDGQRTGDQAWTGGAPPKAMSLLEAVEAAVVEDERSPGEQGVGDVTKNDFAVHGRRGSHAAVGDKQFHQAWITAGCFGRSLPETVRPKTMPVACWRSLLTACKALCAIGHVCAERRVRTHRLWRSFGVGAALQRGRTRRRWVLKRG